MKKVVYLSLLACFSQVCFSQTVTDRIYIKGGSSAYEEFLKTIYQYPAFIPGIVLLKSGQRFYKPLNYNKINAAIEFINEKNDTLTLAQEETVNTVIINNDVYFYTPACVRIIHNDKAKLYKYEKMKVGEVQKIGAMGIPNSGSAIESVSQIDTHERSYDIDINETIILSRAATYLVELPDHQFVPANKKNFLKAYPTAEGDIKEFTKSKNTNFNKESDLVELVTFLDGKL